MKCRHCQTPLTQTFVDLGFAPPSNAYLSTADLAKPEHYYPLKVRVCGHCWLVQTEDYTQADALFNADYAYFSSTSTSWLAHAQSYVENIIPQLNLDASSHVLEVACNDGYLLQNFVKAGIPCLGIEPTASTAAAAESHGIPVIRAFFGEALGKQLANEGKQADLIIGNNVYAHVPDINDFTKGLKAALKPNGTLTLEFPHLMQLIAHAQFDTIYHEHFSYLSLQTACRILQAAGLHVWQVEELPTHGGSLRIFAGHAEDNKPVDAGVERLLQKEKEQGLAQLPTYLKFLHRAEKIKNDLLAFLIEQKRKGKTVVGYGAAAKGNTLLNYAGIKPDLLPYICDAAPSKQGKYMPGSHIPILAPEHLEQEKPDYLLILPWNLAEEVRQQLPHLKAEGVHFVTAVPELIVI